MHNKIVSLKATKLGLNECIIALTIGKKSILHNIAVSRIRNLSSQQALGLLQRIDQNKIKMVFSNLSDKLTGDKDFVIVTLSLTPYYDVPIIYNSLGEDLKTNEDILVAYLEHVGASFTFKTFMSLASKYPEFLDNKQVVLAALKDAYNHEVKEIFKIISNRLKQDKEIQSYE